MTGLPKGLALDEGLDRHEQTTPFSVLALDFDGMREANAVFASYELGGDVLIRAVGEALSKLRRGPEFAARLHTGGDEFVLVLPGVDETEAGDRAEEIENQLDALSSRRRTVRSITAHPSDPRVGAQVTLQVGFWAARSRRCETERGSGVRPETTQGVAHLRGTTSGGGDAGPKFDGCGRIAAAFNPLNAR